MQREHVLHDKLRRVAVLAVAVILNIEADDIVTFGEQPLGPAAESRKKVYSERARHFRLANHAASSRTTLPSASTHARRATS